jgi:prolycopene isomerase
MWLSFPTMLDPSLAPEGEHLVIATSLMPFDIGEPWPDVKQRYTDLMIEEVEHVLPGFRESMTFTDSATPEVFERFTLSQQGAIYGWANTPNQTMPKRLDHVSPIEGLYLAGHWTDPGTGSVRCLLSGLRTAATIMGHQDPIAFLGELHERAATSRR